MATGSLLGKADATLVAGSYREAMADVPADMSKVYEKREKTLKEFTTEVNKIWEKQFEDYKAFETRIIDKSDLALTNVIQGKSNTHNLESVQREVFRIKETMKTFDKKGKDKGNVEWKKLEEELNKLVITTGANAEAFNSLNEAITNNELHITGAPPKILELYEAMVDDYNNDGSKTKAEYVDGDFVYTHPEDPTVKMTFTELQKKLEIKDSKVPTAMQTVINGVKKHAATSKRPFTKRYANDINNQLVKLMKTPNDIVNVMHERFEGLDYSFYEALTTGSDPALQAQIHDALLSVGTDIDNDGNIDTKKTYLDAENAVALQKEIINGPHSKQIIADFLTDNIVADNWKIGEGERKVDLKTTKETKNTGFLSTKKGVYSGNLDRSFSYNVAKNMYDNMGLAIDGKKATFPLGGTLYSYDPIKDNWTVGDDDFGNTDKLIKNLGVDNDPDFKALLTTAAEVTETSTEEFIPKVYKEKRIQKTAGEFNYGDEFEEQTGLDIKYLDMDDDDLAMVLNASIPPQGSENPNGYYFDAPDVAGFASQWIGLYDGNNDRVGDFKIKTNQGLSGNKDYLNNLLLELKRYGLLENFKSLPKPGEPGYLKTPGSGGGAADDIE